MKVTHVITPINYGGGENLIINLIIFKTGKTHNNLDGYLIIIVALISYFSLTTAIIETIKYRRKKE